MRLLRNHGAEPKYFHKRIGGNFRLDALQAAVLRVKLPHLEGWTARRRENADRYDRLFADSPAADRITRAGPRMPTAGTSSTSTSSACRSATPCARASRPRGIGTEIYYPVPFHLQECFAPLGYRRGDFPAAEAAAADTLALPIYSELTEAQQREVVDAVALGRPDARPR